MKWYLEVLKKYAVGDGRARRKEYWMFYLFSTIIGLVLSFVDGFLGTNVGNLGLLSGLYGLAIFIPSIAVAVRRLHDTNRNGGWWFIIFVPLIGGIVFLVFMVQDSQPGENKYGPNPKAVMA
ncbi:MAG: DUF805 domain-containing protein [Chloroflexota bacterium]